ncbi:MAG TPA: hypothetical protein VM260_26970 [Pirellula sp.]|nr:hypothetical protein [Pirellula sp.]
MSTQQIDEPKMTIVLPKLSDGEILGLLGYAEAKLNQQRFVPFCSWLTSVLRAEVERRTNKLREPEMLSLPGEWTNAEAGDALLGCFCLSRSGITMAQCVFVDNILFHLVADCSARLEQYQ